MTSAGAQRRPRRPPAADGATPAPRRPRWVLPLVAGLCFGLGYAITDRLLISGGAAVMPMGQGFEVKPFPGTSLETLRMRFGADKTDIRGDLERLELEETRKQDEAKRLRQEQQDRRAEEEADARPAVPEEPPLQPVLPEGPAPVEPRPAEPAPPPPLAPEPPAPQP
ncbi:hypothetical protein KBY66_14005 [Synechococcus sp. Tobar12-5m-g]|uniref:hypothetical protein n=1 Tax=unclassified Synechococcus TaxID=2626047 RepID=UPI0020CD3ED1|nr:MULTISPECIES: hypothetical protein [unclassified Synechococcus]MCP9773711.1 hypothetical protein [Synechococcus sp. Tobar12-5m-g]MCP9874677.1 hypothetical protein [Synechococcus sp. Cruz CV-v-12]